MHHALLRLLQQQPQHAEADDVGEGAPARRGHVPRGQAGPTAAASGAVMLGSVALQVTAVDINALANRVYADEFGVQPRTLDLQRVTAAQLDELAADLWLLTPPCQPYTTTPNARRRDTADPRATSLLHLLSAACLGAMAAPPARLLLENVPGFAGSSSHAALAGGLASAGYELQEFVVSPHQLGVPYSRPRYFALAVRRPLRFPQQYDCSRRPIEHPPSLTLPDGTAIAWPGVYDAGPTAIGSASPGPYQAPSASLGQASPVATTLTSPRPPPLAGYLTSTAPAEPRQDDGGDTSSSGQGSGDPAASTDPWVARAVPAAQLARFWRVLDVVTPSSTYCNCFTKHYADNLLGAGSVLASDEFAARFCVCDARGRLHFAAQPPLPAAALPRLQRTSATGDAGALDVGPHDSAIVPVVWRRRRRGAGAGGGGRRRPKEPSHPSQPAVRRPPGDAAASDADADTRTAEAETEAVVLGLRFFSPAEVAAIHGLPAGWAARADAAGVASRQQYGLLGNGLSVDVAANLLGYLLAAD